MSTHPLPLASRLLRRLRGRRRVLPGGAAVLAVLAVLATTVVLTGGPSSADARRTLATACATTDRSTSVPTCRRLYPTGTALRLPAGTTEHPYGALRAGIGTFVTVRGRTLPLSAKVTDSFGSAARYGTLVYRATVSDGRVTALRPVLKVPSSVVMQHVFAGRYLSGLISARTSEAGATPEYAGEPALPVVLRVSPGGTRATILNDTRALRFGGRCFAALDGRRDDPLVDGFTAQVSLVRTPGMHAPFDDELVMAWNDSSSGMGSGFYPSLALLFGRDGLAGTWEVMQHGDPASGPGLNLRLRYRAAVAEC